MKQLVLILTFCFASFYLFGQYEEDTYFKGRVIVKVEPNYAKNCKRSSIEVESIQELIKKLQIKRVEKLFPLHRNVSAEKRQREKFVDLSTIYRFHFDTRNDHRKILIQLNRNEAIKYAEFEFVNRPSFSPTDTLNIRQWYLGAIKAYEAWDIEQGDTNVVMAIIDTGSDLDHEDMKGNYALNYNDPINGIDDDNDGYIDNFIGWDLANNDNDPSFSFIAHGLNVASIAGARTNNVTGISGVGFNSRILPIRTDPDSTPGILTEAFQGIVYAADHGAFIINNSWGSYSYSQLGQDIVNYATFNKGALVIAATGNGPFSGPNTGIGIESPFYPAAYENVLSVGALIEGDTIKTSSNFGYWADIFAPGENMFVASGAGGYGINGGTSMASPVVAGAAALVKSHFPEYSPQQVTQKLLSSADNVDNVNADRFKGKLGVGRVNALRALTDTLSPGIDFINRTISDNNNQIFSRGDTLFIHGSFVNYLANATSVVASINTIDNNLTIIDGTSELGDISTLDSSSNQEDPFILVIGPEITFNKTIIFELTIKANNNTYEKKVFFSLDINPDFLTVRENNLTVTLTSKGSIGFAGSANTLGEGIRYLNGNSLLFDGSLLIGNSSDYILNRYRNNSGGIDNDFRILSFVQEENTQLADFKAQAIFDDGKLSTTPKLEITQTNFVFKSGSLSNSVFHFYKVKNLGAEKINALYAGLIIDWDIEDFSSNKIIYDSERKMGISFSTDTNLFIGVRVFEDRVAHLHYAIDNAQSGNGGIDITDGITDEEKFQLISSNRAQAGNINNRGNDISDVNSVGPFDIDKDSSKLIAFAIIVAESLSELEEKADSTTRVFERLLLSLSDPPGPVEELLTIFPNPANNSVSIDFTIRSGEELTIQAYDMQGKLIHKQGKQFYAKGNHLVPLNTSSWKTGVYLLKIQGNNFTKKNNFVVSH